MFLVSISSIKKSGSLNIMKDAADINLHDFHNAHILATKNAQLSLSGDMLALVEGTIFNANDICATKVDPALHNCTGKQLLDLYMNNGINSFHLLEGQFIIIIIDKRTDTIMVFRDQIGIKPLFYANGSNDDFLISDSIDSLIRIGEIKPVLNTDKVFELFTFRYISGRDTIYRGIHQVLPGEYISFKNNDISVHNYFEPSSLFNTTLRIGAESAARSLDALIEQNVNMRISQKAHGGIMLSGGLDSLYLTKKALKKHPRLKTYTLGFDSSGEKDIEFVKNELSGLSIDPRFILINSKDYADRLPKATRSFKFPIDHPNFVGRDILFEKAHDEGLEYLISGDGADTLFGGGWYISLKKYMAVKSFLPKFIAGPLSVLLKNRQKLIKKILQSSINELIIYDRTYTPQEQINKLLLKDMISSRDPFIFHWDQLAKVSNLHPIDRAFYMALLTTVAVYARDQYIMGESNGTTIEYPFLDLNITRFITSIPSNVKLPGYSAKFLLKKAAQLELSDKLINRKKYGLPVPLAQWFRDKDGLGRYIDDLTSSASITRRLYDNQCLSELVSQFEAGDDSISEILWVLVNLEVWMREFNVGIE